MSDQARRLRLSDDLLRRFGAAVRAVQLYSERHPLVARNLEALTATLLLMHVYEASVTIGILEHEVIVGELPLPRTAESMAELMRRLQTAGIERITIDRGVTPDEISMFVQHLARAERRPAAGRATPSEPPLPPLAHIRVGRIQAGERTEGTLADMATIRKLYAEAVSIARVVWESAQAESRPDPAAARSIVENLAHAVSQNRSALLALTALKDYDNYTFTHMVNVSILTMGQARGLGIDGALLREFGLAALMHDIGKVRTPNEILTKPDRLTSEEFAVIKRHVIDGAEILRRTPEIPGLAPIVAFEHHLRHDGSGYPEGIRRASLNLATVLCSISDVYDAMRSQRQYQDAFATDRILAVLHEKDGTQFDPHLVRRFVQLVGIYPPGNMVRLNTDEIAVVLRVHAPDPYRPKVRVLFTKERTPLEYPLEINLWEIEPHSGQAHTIAAPVDPRAYATDPLSVLH